MRKILVAAALAGSLLLSLTGCKFEFGEPEASPSTPAAAAPHATIAPVPKPPVADLATQGPDYDKFSKGRASKPSEGFTAAEDRFATGYQEHSGDGLTSQGFTLGDVVNLGWITCGGLDNGKTPAEMSIIIRDNATAKHLIVDSTTIVVLAATDLCPEHADKLPR